MKNEERDAWKGAVAFLILVIYSTNTPESVWYVVGAGVLGLVLAMLGFSMLRVSWFWSKH